MNSNLNGGSAKIYQFPIKARAMPAPASVGYAYATIGSSWYHEEAVQESTHAPREVARTEVVRPKAVILPLTFPRQ